MEQEDIKKLLITGIIAIMIIMLLYMLNYGSQSTVSLTCPSCPSLTCPPTTTSGTCAPCPVSGTCPPCPSCPTLTCPPCPSTDNKMIDYALTRNNFCYNLAYNYQFPYAPNYAFDTTNPFNTNYTDGPAVAKICDSYGNCTDSATETQDLRNTLRLYSAVNKCGDYCIYNAQTKDSWTWNPDSDNHNRATNGKVGGGYWTRTKWATSPHADCFTVRNGAVLDNVALNYQYVDQRGDTTNGTPSFPYTRKYWL